MDKPPDELDFFVILPGRLDDVLRQLASTFGEEVGGPPMDPTETLSRVIYEAAARHLKRPGISPNPVSKGSA